MFQRAMLVGVGHHLSDLSVPAMNAKLGLINPGILLSGLDSLLLGFLHRNREKRLLRRDELSK